MNQQVEGIDNKGVRRVYGVGRDMDEAIQMCRIAAGEYLVKRPDIKALYLQAADTQRPIIDCSNKHQMKVTS